MRGHLQSLGDLGSGDAMTFPTEAERQARLHKRAGCDCEEEAMPIDLDEVRKRHKRCSGLARCRMPCDATQLADEAEHLRSKYTASQDEMTELLTEHRKQGEEVERQAGLFAVARKESEGLANLIVERDNEIARHKQERRDNFDEIKERF
jgi:hypothetical protein